MVQIATTTVAATYGTNSTYVDLDEPSQFPAKNWQSAMQLRQHCNSSQWMIVVFCPPPYQSNSYIVLYLEKERGHQIVQNWYPTAVNAIRLPSSMSSVLRVIWNKKINGSSIFWHELILRSIGELALISPRQGFNTLEDRFASEMEANDYFIDIIVETYIITVIHSERKSLRGRLKAKVSNARELWLIKRNEHRQNELYLGRVPFHDELRRSCEEFYATLRNIWGFSPLKLFYMK